jgi:hypothetical protein
MTKTCDDCKKEIEGTFYEVDGKTICSKDYDEVVKPFDILTVLNISSV